MHNAHKKKIENEKEKYTKNIRFGEHDKEHKIAKAKGSEMLRWRGKGKRNNTKWNV